MGGLGTDGRGGSAVGLSSSVCTLVVHVRARCPCARSLSCARSLLCVGGVSSLSKGGGSSSVGGGRLVVMRGWRSRLVVVSGCGAVVVGAGLLLVAQGCRLEAVGLLRMGGLLVGAGLWFVGAVVTCCLLCGQH